VLVPELQPGTCVILDNESVRSSVYG
jgi:hypothetical protein